MGAYGESSYGMALVSLFRQEAIDHQSAREPIDRLAQVTVPYDWLVLLLIAATCLFVLLWAAFVKIELTLPVDVVVIKPADDRTIESPVTARVSDVPIDVGSHVDVGDTLVRVVMPDLHLRLSEAEERERLIREELALTSSNDAELNRMLIESRVEAAALKNAIERDEVISSTYAGEVVELGVATGHVAMIGQEVVRVRVRESADSFAIGFVPPSRIESVPGSFEASISCPGEEGTTTFDAHEIGQLPVDFVASNLLPDNGFDPSHHQLPMAIPASITVAHSTLCTGRILLEARTPLDILLGRTQGSDVGG